ncbi:deoxyribodipyrimidine photo-lyase [Sphingomonas sp. HF-S3]|uniref:Deoxyribodipyrimidine photo-lyase n=1 Tax=Sphingomonas rustica TaxID=3103142 RepID=A0ABV0B817_9SPHN
MTPSILWLRQDLRLQDQPALVAAAAEGAVIPVYVLDDETPRKWRMGGASRWWLHHSLAALAKALAAKGSRLILRRGRTAEVLAALADETGAATIHANRHHEPWWVEAEEALGDRLCRHDGNHLAPLREIVTGSGGQYRVYSAFWRALSQRMPPADPLPVPRQIPAPAHWPKSDRLADWDLLPTKPDWSNGFADWEPGEVTALRRADEFVDEVVDYEARRDLPDVEGTSRLSPHLHFGEIGPRTLWHTLDGARNAEKFRKEMAWRDFAASLLIALPDYGDTNGRPAFDAMKWRRSPSDLKAWQQGRTGYPIVDAGMRQLWTTGWMHNRVRMITASFLIKHLLIDWREGERWFWDTLVDADYGNNSVNWQWVAGTGVDSNMWGRIMAPLVQSEKFDAAGYIREWVPELRDLGDADIHDPVFRPKDYPDKIIGHREARERALAAGRALR